MKIETNLNILTLTSVTLIILMGLVMLLAFDQINREFAHYNDINKIAKDMSELSIVTHEYFMHHEKRMLQQWLLKYDSVAGILERIEKKEIHPEHLPILKSIISDYKILGDLFSQLQANLAKRKRLIKESRPQKEIDVTHFLEERMMAHALMSIQKITSEALKFSAVMQKSVRQVQQRANLIVIFSIIGFVILSSYISFLVVKAIIRPLNELVKGTEIIGKGNFKHRVDIRTKNEIGELATSFNQMTENLTEVTASRDELNAVNQQLRASEQQLKAANQQLQASEQQLRASEQQLRASNQQLRADEQQLRAEIAERKKMEEQTKKQLHDLEIFYKASRGREEKVLELKKRVRELEAKLGKKPDNE